MIKWSSRSLSNFVTCDERLRKIADKARELFPKVDFTIIEGQRTIAQHKANLANGTSWAKLSKHCYGPSYAFDFIPYPFKNWKDTKGFEAVGKALIAAAKALGIKARWGGDWNQNGTYTDEIARGSYDGGHFELMEPYSGLHAFNDTDNYIVNFDKTENHLV